MDKKVSIIVVIFKVSEYVRECLESIMNQTYKNIEIICIVGDTDTESMKITKELADKDSRIVYKTVKPEGVSAARNEGLRNVSGDYIAFVDGDDYIENDMIETLVSALEKEQADISVVAKYYLYKNTVEGFYRDGNKVMNSCEVMEEVLEGSNFFLHLWDKLYKRDLFTGIFFDTGAVCEDRQVCFDLLMRAEKTVFVPKSKYYFRQSLDSSSKIYKNVEDSLSEDYKICTKLLEKYPELINDIDLFLLKENLSVIQSSFLYGVYTKENVQKNIDNIKKHLGGAKKSKHVYKGIIIKAYWAILATQSFGKSSVKRRKEFLKNHVHFTSGNDWEKIFKEIGTIK